MQSCRATERSSWPEGVHQGEGPAAPCRQPSAITSAASTVFDVVGAEHEVSTSPGGLGAMLEGADRMARFSDNLSAEPRYERSGIGRVIGAAGETAVETAAAGAGSRIRAHAGASVTTAALIGTLDAVVDVDDAPKIITAFGSNVDPGTTLSSSASLLYDLGTTALNPSHGLGNLHSVRDELVNGAYGGALQGATLLGAIASEDADTQRHITSADAEQGEAGVFVAWGNAAGDLWADLRGGGSTEPRVIPVEEVERRAWGFGLRRDP